MADASVDEKIVGMYAQQVADLTKTIAALKSKVAYLENELTLKEELPVPKSVILQIMEMEAKIRKQQQDIDYYKKFVPVQIIINRENKDKPTRSGGVPKKDGNDQRTVTKKHITDVSHKHKRVGSGIPKN